MTSTRRRTAGALVRPRARMDDLPCHRRRTSRLLVHDGEWRMAEWVDGRTAGGRRRVISGSKREPLRPSIADGPACGRIPPGWPMLLLPIGTAKSSSTVQSLIAGVRGGEERRVAGRVTVDAVAVPPILGPVGLLVRLASKLCGLGPHARALKV